MRKGISEFWIKEIKEKLTNGDAKFNAAPSPCFMQQELLVGNKHFRQSTFDVNKDLTIPHYLALTPQEMELPKHGIRT